MDDNRDLLQILQIILKGQGYDTILASCIEEAEQKVKVHRPALLLMDVFISDEDGRQFCNRLKSNPETSGIRVIMMSGIDPELNLSTCVNADDFMQKPFDYNDLLERIHRQLAGNDETSACS